MKLKIYTKVHAFHCCTKTSIISNSYSTKTKPKFRPKSSKASISKDAEKELSFNKEKRRLKPQLDLVKGEIIYGVYPVLMALKSGKRQINEVYYNKNTERVGQVVELAKTKNIIVTSTSPNDLQILARNSTIEKNSHQGICAYVEKVNPITYSNDDEYSKEDFKTLSLLLCGIGDPHNLGSIIRSSYFCGVDSVFTTDCIFEGIKSEPFLKSSAPLSPVVSKASSGVLEIFQPIHVNDSTQFIKALKYKGFSIVGSGINSDPSSKDNMQDRDNKVEKSGSETEQSQLLIIGNEGFGIPNDISKLCDKWIYLQPGRELDSDVDSLNVSVATALLINSMKNLDLYSYV